MPELRAGGLLAEFDSPEGLLGAVRELRRAGAADLETYTPFAVPGLADALGLRRSRLPVAVFTGGLLGGTASYLIQWWTNVVSYPVNAGGRPTHALPAFIFPTFEGLVLIGSCTAFFGCLVALRLPDLWKPVDEVEGFERASVDRYFVEVRGAAGDERIAAVLRTAGALRVLPLEAA